jgi:hypothetical protein
MNRKLTIGKVVLSLNNSRFGEYLLLHISYPNELEVLSKNRQSDVCFLPWTSPWNKQTPLATTNVITWLDFSNSQLPIHRYTHYMLVISIWLTVTKYPFLKLQWMFFPFYVDFSSITGEVQGKKQTSDCRFLLNTSSSFG